MKNDKETEANLAERNADATSDKTLSNVRENEKRSVATTDDATTDSSDEALATPDGQFDGESSSRRDADPM